MKPPKLIYVAQIVAAIVLIMASGTKFLGDPKAIELFTRLGMEPTGRFVIATIEVTAALLLLSPFAATGSVLSIAVMCGAIIAHCTRLGLVVHDDGGGMVLLLVLVLLCSCYVLVTRRKELPFVGDTL